MNVKGKVGYKLREMINEFRCWQIKVSDKINNVCFKVIRYLDSIESIAEERRKDRSA